MWSAEYRREYNEKYAILNAEKLKRQKRDYYRRNKEHQAEYARQYYASNKEQRKKWAQIYYWSNREARLEYVLAYCQDETLALADNGGLIWDGDELQYLIKNSKLQTVRGLAIHFGRSYFAVRNKARKLGIRFHHPGKHKYQTKHRN